MVNIQPPSQEQILTEIGLGFMWLNKWKDYADDRQGDFMTKYNSFMLKMVGEVESYLKWWNQEDFFDWLELLEIDEEIKSGFYKIFADEKENPIPF